MLLTFKNTPFSEKIKFLACVGGAVQTSDFQNQHPPPLILDFFSTKNCDRAKKKISLTKSYKKVRKLIFFTIDYTH